MRTESNAEKNIPPGLTICTPWRVSSVAVMPAYCIHVTFVDKLQGIVDMSRLISSETAGVFAALRDVNTFNQVSVIHGVATWPGEIDLAPDAMYDAIKIHGIWVL
ncbi:MAG: DUF2442 domain-containing protein [Alphaproteobacteria bacterium]|nr:DUF2442 domain-containing protein [Alphaproteobacteria bacterium]